jgi:hypothetical protein
MLSFILKDKGTKFHNKITEANYLEEKNRLVDIQQDMVLIDELLEYGKEFVKLYASDFEWFDSNALKHADKENLAKFVWLLVQPFELQLEKEGVADKYGYNQELHPTKKELKAFDAYFKTRSKIGCRFSYIYADAKWTSIFSTGFQLARLIIGPFGFIAGRIPFVALFFFIMWIQAAVFDWIVLAIPYLISWQSSKVPRDYYDSDLLIGPYLYGEMVTVKNDLRELVRKDASNSAAYEAFLWGQFMREKFIEIIRKQRNNPVEYVEHEKRDFAETDKPKKEISYNTLVDTQPEKADVNVKSVQERITQELNEYLPVIQKAFKELVEESVKDIHEDEFAAVIFEIHKTLPLPVRMLVSKDKLLKFCLNNKELLLPKKKMGAVDLRKLNDGKTDNRKYLLPSDISSQRIIDFLGFQQNYNIIGTVEENTVRFEFKGKNFIIYLDNNDIHLYSIALYLDGIHTDKYEKDNMINAAHIAMSEVFGIKFSLPFQNTELNAFVICQNYCKDVDRFLKSNFINSMAALARAENKFREALVR